MCNGWPVQRPSNGWRCVGWRKVVATAGAVGRYHARIRRAHHRQAGRCTGYRQSSSVIFPGKPTACGRRWPYQDQRIETALSVSEVRFSTLDAASIRRYVASGEPMDKAGAYGIQGKAGVFVEHIVGSYTGIMGLPLHETALLLRRFGYSVELSRDGFGGNAGAVCAHLLPGVTKACPVSRQLS